MYGVGETTMKYFGLARLTLCCLAGCVEPAVPTGAAVEAPTADIEITMDALHNSWLEAPSFRGTMSSLDPPLPCIRDPSIRSAWGMSALLSGAVLWSTRLIIGVGINVEKTPLFTAPERVEFVSLATAHLRNVDVAPSVVGRRFHSQLRSECHGSWREAADGYRQ